MSNLRVTRQQLAVATVFIEAGDAPQWGYRLAEESGVALPNIYPMLARWTELGWLEPGGCRDDGAPTGEARRCYQLTDLGKAELGKRLA